MHIHPHLFRAAATVIWSITAAQIVSAEISLSVIGFDGCVIQFSPSLQNVSVPFALRFLAEYLAISFAVRNICATHSVQSNKSDTLYAIELTR